MYEYDGMNRLISSKDRTGGSSYYVYDDANNILKAFCFNEDVKGDWYYKYSKGCLESVNGDPILYDKKGNIESFGKNHYQWEMGSLLTKAYQGDSAICFRYDAMNNPIFKDSERDGVTRLVWEGRRLVAQANAKNMMSFLYDCFGSVIGFNYSEHFYAYCKNTFQDVVAIIRDDGRVVAEYSYGDFGEPGKVNDADGSGLAFMNPFRYRSYYFDQDLGLYYLRSRWYSPELRRFLSSDSPKTMLDEAYKKELLLNRYSYCANNPIAYIDSQGTVLDVAAMGAAIVLFGFFVFCVLIVAEVGAYIQAGNATSGFGGTTTSPYTPETPTYQPVPSVAEPPVMEEPIVEGGGTIAEQPDTETQFDPLSDADVQKGLKMLEGALGMALASAKLRIGRRYRHQTENHHIVPQNVIDLFQLLPNIRSYMALCYVGGVNNYINIVEISTLLHKGLHNILYVQGVALVFDPITYFLPSVGEPFFSALLGLIRTELILIDHTLMQ